MKKMIKVYLVFDQNLANATKHIQNVKNRSHMIYALVSSYQLLGRCNLLAAELATDLDLLSFHTTEYVNYLKNVSLSKDLDNLDTEEYNLEYDCPLFECIYHFSKIIVGGSLTAAKKLVSDKDSDQQLIAINWCGGWHHAQRDSAEGFCYVNDIVIAIQYLGKWYKKILYVDLDVHHGNGVENAFIHTQRVMTLSLHKYSPGFYPGTGSLEDVGIGYGRYYCINVPLKDGITDDPYVALFQSISSKIRDVYKPECVVVQCGADCLAGDPLGGFNLTPAALERCLEILINWKVPMLILAGGGYHLPNAARCYAYLTSKILGVTISNDIPEHEYFNAYGPSFELEVSPSLRKDENAHGELEKIEQTILENLNKIKN